MGGEAQCGHVGSFLGMTILLDIRDEIIWVGVGLLQDPVLPSSHHGRSEIDDLITAQGQAKPRLEVQNGVVHIVVIIVGFVVIVGHVVVTVVHVVVIGHYSR